MSKSKPDPAVEMLETLEKVGDLTAFLTGMKAQYVAQGWSDQGAELATLTVFTLGAKMGQQ